MIERAPSRRTAKGDTVRAAILRDGHAQQAARDLLRIGSVGVGDQFHGIAALLFFKAPFRDDAGPSLDVRTHALVERF